MHNGAVLFLLIIIYAISKTRIICSLYGSKSGKRTENTGKERTAIE